MRVRNCMRKTLRYFCFALAPPSNAYFPLVPVTDELTWPKAVQQYFKATSSFSNFDMLKVAIIFVDTFLHYPSTAHLNTLCVLFPLQLLSVECLFPTSYYQSLYVMTVAPVIAGCLLLLFYKNGKRIFRKKLNLFPRCEWCIKR